MYIFTFYLSLFRYFSFSFQFSPGLPSLQDAVVLLGIDIEWFFLNAITTGESRQGEQSIGYVWQHLHRAGDREEKLLRHLNRHMHTHNLSSQGNLTCVGIGRINAQSTSKLCCQKRCDGLLLLLVLLL